VGLVTEKEQSSNLVKYNGTDSTFFMWIVVCYPNREVSDADSAAEQAAKH